MNYAANNSHILSGRGEEKSFKIVLRKIKNAELPIVTKYQDGTMGFYYEDLKITPGNLSTPGYAVTVKKCDGNTAHHLKNIIEGLIRLYGEES